MNSERLFCALLNGGLVYGKKSVTCLDPNLLNDPELTVVNIIGGLLTALRDSSSSGQRYSQFDNDADIIEKIIFYHGGRVGITERTMQKHFAAARRSLVA